MDQPGHQPIEQLVRRVRRHDLSRGQFIALLTGLGATATGIAALLSTADSGDAAASHAHDKPVPPAVQHHNQKLHDAHVRRQGHATRGVRPSSSTQATGEAASAGQAAALSPHQAQHLQAILDDYADDAVVDDPFFAEPIVGKAAIAQRKLAEMAAMRDATIEVTNRFAYHNQVVAEWTLRGIHQGDFLGYAATGRQIHVQGVTVVTREGGKITRESLHYDVAAVHRQFA
jgi:steroid delta-isomerase-like uncharacterized protein